MPELITELAKAIDLARALPRTLATEFLVRDLETALEWASEIDLTDTLVPANIPTERAETPPVVGERDSGGQPDTQRATQGHNV
jgi:hypothetical protein